VTARDTKFTSGAEIFVLFAIFVVKKRCMDERALADFALLRDELFAIARKGSLKDVLALGCPACGGALVVCWMRQLIPFVGRDALNVRCGDTRCSFIIQADGKIPRPPWAGTFSGTLTTQPGTMVRPRLPAKE
jgi:hypothetical protein